MCRLPRSRRHFSTHPRATFTFIRGRPPHPEGEPSVERPDVRVASFMQDRFVLLRREDVANAHRPAARPLSALTNLRRRRLHTRRIARANARSPSPWKAGMGDHEGRAGLKAAMDFNQCTSPFFESHEVQCQNTGRRVETALPVRHRCSPGVRVARASAAPDSVRPASACRRTGRHRQRSAGMRLRKCLNLQATPAPRNQHSGIFRGTPGKQ